MQYYRGKSEQECDDGFEGGGVQSEGGPGAVIQYLQGGESSGQGEKSGEVGWAGTPGGLGVRVPLEQGWLRGDICSPGECDGEGGFLLEEVMGRVSQKS